MPATSFTSIFNPFEDRPRSQFFTGFSPANFLRDSLTLPAWISVGAFLQCSLFILLPTRIAILPVVLYLISRLIDNALVFLHIRPNSYMSGVIIGKTSAQFPGSTMPSQNPIVVIKLAARSNHPLGILNPHYRAISGFFKRMIQHLDENSEHFGFLGANSYLGNERATANEIMIMVYFRTYEGLHAFSHEPNGVHREAWSYWNNEIMGKGKTEEGRMFSIMHEVYHVPAQKWENVFINYHPSGIGATIFKVDVDGKERWASPLIDARSGLMRTSKGRMAASSGNDNEIYGDDPYAT